MSWTSSLSLPTLILIMLLGHWIEMKALGEAGDAQKSIGLSLVPKDAHVVLEDDSIETRPVADLQVGDLIRVQAGERCSSRWNDPAWRITCKRSACDWGIETN
nr:hypothetical protein [Leuconostoc mesenteroides]